ncbi:unnamed protein product [Alopecurus aequalis]
MPLIGDPAGSRRFAFALVEPPYASPGFLLRRAMEAVGRNSTVGLVASHYGAMLVIFSSQEARKSTMARFPLSYLGHRISLEQPELAENRFGWSAVPHHLLLLDFEGLTSTQVAIELVRMWSPASTAFSHGGHYAGGGGDTPRWGSPCSDHSCHGGLDDIDTESMDAVEVVDLVSSDGMAGVAASPPPGVCPVDLWKQVTIVPCSDRPSNPLSSPLGSASDSPILLLHWYDTLAPPTSPLAPEQGFGTHAGLSTPPPPRAIASRKAPSTFVFAGSDEHEDGVPKQRVRRKREADSAFKARRSSRLADKEPALFVDMLDRAKAVNTSKFANGKGSPRLRAAVAALRLDDGLLAPIPLP